MAFPLLVAGVDGRSLLFEAPVLQREGHVVQERVYVRDLLQAILPTGARMVVLGTELPDLALPDAVRRIRSSSATQHVSVLALLPAGTSAELEEETRRAGANAVLRRPLDRATLEGWMA